MTLPAMTLKRLGLFIALASFASIALLYFADPGQHLDGPGPQLRPFRMPRSLPHQGIAL